MDIQIKHYAPVLIPTLNRYEHLKACIESLEKCTGADLTDVYVGLDYPPSGKYQKGWEEIDLYLKEKEKSHGFKKISVIRREQNCGAITNSTLLIDGIKKAYKTYIFTEDDNIFSPNFLDFMNKGLALYENNPRVMAVCGYSYLEIEKMKTRSNVIAYRKYSGWGTGHWCDKVFLYKLIGREYYRESILKSLKKTIKLWWIHPISINDFLSMHFRNQTYGDSLANAQLCLEGKYCIFPRKSLVRNCGHDGSGEHCTKSSVFIDQEIDTATTFSFDGLVYSSEFPNDTYFKSCIIKHVVVPFVAIVRYCGYRLTGKDLFWFRFKR